jgi:hypothetical protein
MRELEINIDRLRRLYQQDVTQVRQENEKLKEILQAHGIQHDLGSPSSQNYNASISASLGASPTSFGAQTNHSSNFNSMSPPSHHSSSMQMMQASTPFAQQSASKSLQPPAPNMHGLDYDDMGLGFVAEYERTPYLSPPPN